MFFFSSKVFLFLSPEAKHEGFSLESSFFLAVFLAQRQIKIIINFIWKQKKINYWFPTSMTFSFLKKILKKKDLMDKIDMSKHQSKPKKLKLTDQPTNQT